MKTIQGDLLKLAIDGTFDVIIHGCNCYCTMGAGIAKAIKMQFPEAFETDMQTEKGSKEKLGKISYAQVMRNHHDIIIVNAYTQHYWRGQGVLADYDAIKSCMEIVKDKFSGKKIGYPLIGAGLAKGDWSIIADIIDSEFEGEDHALVVFDQQIS